MNNLIIKKCLYHHTPLNLLSFLSGHPDKIFSANEISKSAKASRGATSQILRFFLKSGLISRERKGNLFLYRVNSDSFIIRQFKIFENLLILQRLAAEIQRYCYQIMLFGSRADGTNIEESDTDLFICTEYKKEVRRIINKYQTSGIKYQVVIQDPLEVASLKKEENVFYRQINNGITLWKGKPTYEEI